MYILSIINHFLAVGLVAILLFGFILICRHQQKSVYRRFLAVMLMFWAVVFCAVLRKFWVGDFSLSLNIGILNMQIILLGLPCFFTLISFPALILNARLSQIKNWIMLTSPMLLFLVIYFVWHRISGLDPFMQYSVSDFLANITSPTIVMRLAISLLFIVYIIALQWTIWSIVPIYNRYIKGNLSDSSCNVDWVRDLIKFICVVGVGYFSLLFTSSLVANMLYLIAVISMFVYIIDQSLFYCVINDLPPLVLRWSTKSGWYVYESEEQVAQRSKQVALADFDRYKVLIDIWLEQDMVYTKVDFTTNDIIERFPELSQDTLARIFRDDPETFQSHVRRLRIERACELMKNNRGVLYPKQIFGMVGFSHYSSFSRSFLAVTGQSPTDYLKGLEKQQDELNSSNSATYPPPHEEAGLEA